MKAILQRDEQLIWEETETPTPQSGEVLIKVQATAINRADLMQQKGFYPPPPGASSILGLECFGEVAGFGPNTHSTLFQAGDLVCALLSGGGYAEYVVCPVEHVIPVPKDYANPMDFAGFAEVYCTVFLNLKLEANLQAGDSVLIHAGASGVGTAAIQYCAANDIDAYVTVGNQQKLDTCLKLGAKAGVIRTEASFAEAVKEWTQGKGLTAILDPVGGAYFEDNLKSLATDGKLVLIGLMGGRNAELDLGRLLIKRLRVVGSTLRSRSNEDKAKIVDGVRQSVIPLVQNGSIQLVNDCHFNITEVNDAFQFVADNKNTGKVILTL